jgi:hypothetical protein
MYRRVRILSTFSVKFEEIIIEFRFILLIVTYHTLGNTHHILFVVWEVFTFAFAFLNKRNSVRHYINIINMRFCNFFVTQVYSDLLSTDIYYLLQRCFCGWHAWEYVDLMSTILSGVGLGTS